MIAGLVALVLQRSDDLAIDEPVGLVRRPVIRIRVKLSLWRIDMLLRTSIVVARNTFTEVVGLHKAVTLIEIIAREFPVELVLIVTHEHYACD